MLYFEMRCLSFTKKRNSFTSKKWAFHCRHLCFFSDEATLYAAYCYPPYFLKTIKKDTTDFILYNALTSFII